MMLGREGWGNESKCNLDSPRREGGEVSWGTKSNELGMNDVLYRNVKKIYLNESMFSKENLSHFSELFTRIRLDGLIY